MVKRDRICSIENCNRKVWCKGYCTKHYQRWKAHGDPLTVLIADRGAPLSFLENVAETDECVRWPYGTSEEGYGTCLYEGKPNKPHRVVLMIRGHFPTAEKDHACHSCDNRWCVNPRHLRWATKRDNANDAASRFRNKRKLTVKDVIEMRSMRGQLHRVIAEKFSVSCSVVTNILNRKSWKQLPE